MNERMENQNYCPRCNAKRIRQEYCYDHFDCGAVWYNENDKDEFATRREMHACCETKQRTMGDCFFQWNSKFDIAEMMTSGE